MKQTCLKGSVSFSLLDVLVLMVGREKVALLVLRLISKGDYERLFKNYIQWLHFKAQLALALEKYRNVQFLE